MIINDNNSNKKVLVVDLDGTLYNINTFHYFIKYLLRFSLVNLNIKLFFKLLQAMFLRVLGVISHSKMKFLILNAIKHNLKLDYKAFVSNIAKYKNEIKQLEASNFDIKILATAAPSCYATIIAENEGFNTCLATNFPETSYRKDFENVREVKKQNVLSYLNSIGKNQVDTIITDHFDDLPLIKVSKHVILINPNKETQNILQQNQIFFNIAK